VIPLGSTIGILGGGQLGRMLAIEAFEAGYRTVIRTDEPRGGPAAQIADDEVNAPYDDEDANERFVNMVDVITAEFENLPVNLLRWFEDRVPVRPGSMSLSICQHRATEKRFLKSLDIPHAEFAVVSNAADAVAAFDQLGPLAVMKSAAFGYDGKGQVRLQAGDDAGRAFASLNVGEVVIEKWVPFRCEISVIGARAIDTSWVLFPPGENIHVNGILDTTIAPARVSAKVAAAADELARTIANGLNHVGTLGVEMFVLDDDSLVVNEIAPRPHNSGHHTIDACTVSQFGLQLDATTGAPLRQPQQHQCAVMVNLLGDLWSNGEPDWSVVEHEPHTFLHLYGKVSARPGRKMGHLTLTGEDIGQMVERAHAQRHALARVNDASN
jgi:5-(carboxyamino)imidazole ribonucleotide synthase